MRYRFTNFTLLAAPGLAAAALVLLLAGCGGSSGTSTPPPIPVAPASLTAAAGNSQINLTWPTVPYASSYNCYWADTEGVTLAGHQGDQRHQPLRPQRADQRDNLLCRDHGG